MNPSFSDPLLDVVPAHVKLDVVTVHSQAFPRVGFVSLGFGRAHKKSVIVERCYEIRNSKGPPFCTSQNPRTQDCSESNSCFLRGKCKFKKKWVCVFAYWPNVSVLIKAGGKWEGCSHRERLQIWCWQKQGESILGAGQWLNRVSLNILMVPSTKTQSSEANASVTTEQNHCLDPVNWNSTQAADHEGSRAQSGRSFWEHLAWHWRPHLLPLLIFRASHCPLLASCFRQVAIRSLMVHLQSLVHTLGGKWKDTPTAFSKIKNTKKTPPPPYFIFILWEMFTYLGGKGGGWKAVFYLSFQRSLALAGGIIAQDGFEILALNLKNISVKLTPCGSCKPFIEPKP